MQIGNRLAHRGRINRGVAHALVEENDLTERPDRVTVQAHAVAFSRRSRTTGSCRDGPSATLR